MKVQNNQDLSDFNSYRLRSYCKRAFFPENEQEVIDLFKGGSDFILLGSGHNIILKEEFYNKDFIIFNGNYDSVKIDYNDGIIGAEAGVSMFFLSTVAAENGLTGLEVFYDIPSSLGGAVVMNAGASGEEIKDILVKVRFLDLSDNQIKEADKNELDFTYRNSVFQRDKNKIILKAWLKLGKLNSAEIISKMESIKSARWAKQPREFPSAGSVFKRPEGRYVGPMLDELGLKGFSVGGAKISEKHSGFIINYNNASGADILDLISEVKNRVRESYGIDLEVEQRII